MGWSDLLEMDPGSDWVLMEMLSTSLLTWETMEEYSEFVRLTHSSMRDIPNGSVRPCWKGWACITVPWNLDYNHLCQSRQQLASSVAATIIISAGHLQLFIQTLWTSANLFVAIPTIAVTRCCCCCYCNVWINKAMRLFPLGTAGRRWCSPVFNDLWVGF